MASSNTSQKPTRTPEHTPEHSPAPASAHSPARLPFVLLALISLIFIMVGAGVLWGGALTQLWNQAWHQTSGASTETVSLDQPLNKAEWTVMLYLCGSDLEEDSGDASRTLDELLQADIPDSINVLVKTGGARTWKNASVDANKNQTFVVRDHQLKLLSSEVKRSMGDEKTLSSFMETALDYAPAEHVALILWNHGAGPQQGVCFDDPTQPIYLSLDELNSAVSAAATKRGQHIDVIGIDACLMASVEVAAAFEGSADYLVSSQELEPSSSWDYTKLIGSVATHHNDVRALVDELCLTYQQKYEHSSLKDNVSLSAIDITRIPRVGAALNALADEVTAGGLAALTDVAEAARRATSFGGDSAEEGSSNLIDLVDFAERLSPAFKARDELKAAVEDAVVSSLQVSPVVNAHGLSVYFPSGEAPQLDRYVRISSINAQLGTYQQLLRRFFLDAQDTIQITINNISHQGSTLTVSLDPASIEACADAYYELSYLTDEGQKIHLGTDFDLNQNQDAGTISYTPRGSWMTLNGMFLVSSYVDWSDQSLSYSAPVRVNNRELFLRYRFVYDHAASEQATDAPDDGSYVIDYLWPGLNPTTHVPSRELIELEPGDTLTRSTKHSDTLPSVFGTAQVTDIEALDIADKALPAGTYEVSIHVRTYTNDDMVVATAQYTASSDTPEAAHMELTRVS